MTKIPDDFIITRQDKQFVLYAGLLNEAHNQGLRCINTELLQAPAPHNDQVAICRAEAIFELDDEHSALKETLLRNFSGIGDASPENVGRNIAPHIIRMAETRAKARALRDAINVGMTALEELGEAGAESGESVQREPSEARTNTGDRLREGQQRASRAASPRGEGGYTREERPPTPKQLNYLKSLIDDSVEGGDEKFQELAGAPVEELSRHDVSEWIGKLSGKAG